MTGKPNIFSISYLANEHRSDVLLILTLSVNSIESMTMRLTLYLNMLKMEHTASNNNDILEENRAFQSALHLFLMTTMCQVLYVNINYYI